MKLKIIYSTNYISLFLQIKHYYLGFYFILNKETVLLNAWCQLHYLNIKFKKFYVVLIESEYFKCILLMILY